MGCGCQNKNPLPRYTNLSSVPTVPWDEGKFVLGRDECGNIIILEKPVYELSEEDRDKLDSIQLDGEGDLYLSDDGTYKQVTIYQIDGIDTNGSGNLFLSNDGTYKSIDYNNIEWFTLTYAVDSSEFVERNLTELNGIKDKLNAGFVAFVRIDFNGLLIPVNVLYSNQYLTFVFDSILSPVPVVGRAITADQKRLQIIIRLANNISLNPLQYDIQVVPDANNVLQYDGDGKQVLFNDGVYKPVYTTGEIDSKIGDGLGNYYNKDEVDGVINDVNNRIDSVNDDLNYKIDTVSNELNDSIEAVRDEVDEKISAVDERLSDAVFYDDNNDIVPRGNIRLGNNQKVLGADTTGAEFNLIELSKWDIVDVGTGRHHINLNSDSRPTVQLTGETGDQSHPIAYQSEVIEVGELLNNEIANRQTADDNLQTQIDAANEYAQDTRNALLEAQETINEDLGKLGDRVSQNETDIAQNKTDIAGIRQDIADTEHFRGYHLTTDEITAIERPESGDYAWNAETGTVWTYNGTTWLNSGAPIPDQSAPAYDGTPLEDGEASPGFTNEYSRGDHRHPSDSSKADLTALNDYLPLAGNSQTTPVTGDIWISNESSVRLSSSGNSFIAFSENDATLQIKGNGIGGIDLQSDNGVVKANGQRVIVNGQNTPNVQIAAPIIQFNATEASGSGLSLGSAQTALSGNIFSGTFTGNIGLTSSTGDISLNTVTGKAYYGASNIPGNEIAKLSDIEEVRGEGETNLTEAKQYTDEKVAEAKTDITAYTDETFVKKSGDTMTGNLTFEEDNYLQFTSDGFTHIGYDTSVNRLIVETVRTDGGIDIRTNPSVPESKLFYNGVEVATVENIVPIIPENYETETNGTVVLLPEIPSALINVIVDRVPLYPSDYTLTGSAINITADLDLSEPREALVTYLKS